MEANYVQYLACDGTWKEIPSQFAIDSLEATPGWSTNRLHVRSKLGATFLANHTGRMFRMAVQCRSLQEVNVPSNSSSCVMFKVQGRISCPLPRQNPLEPSVPLPKPSAGAIILTTGTLPPLTTPAEKLTGTSSKNLTSTTGAHPPQNTPTEETNEVSPRPSEGGEKDFLMGVITGLSASMIILLVIVGLLVYRCRNTRAGTANATGNSTQDTVMGNPQTNSDFERDYESVNNSISSEPWELHTYVRMEGVPQHPPVNDAPESDQTYITMQGGQGRRGFGHIYENSRGVL